jgi:hypothetical protein
LFNPDDDDDDDDDDFSLVEVLSSPPDALTS